MVLRSVIPEDTQALLRWMLLPVPHRRCSSYCK